MAIRTVFFGSPEFAVPSLRALATDPRFQVPLVVTQPDRPAGRGRRLVEPAVKVAATDLDLAVWQPMTLRSDEAVDRLRDIKPDLFVVVAYGEIFRRAVLDIPAHGCLNIHPSLLPKYRGSSPIPAAILNGDATTGVSIIRMVRKLDAGPILAQREIRLNGTETSGQLSERLGDLAAVLLPDVAAAWCEGTIEPVEQSDDNAIVTRELAKYDGQLDWTESARQLERQVRAYSPWPATWTTLDGRRLVVHSAEVWPEIPHANPGQIFEDNRHVLVACGEESLCLVQVQPEGKKIMLAEDWFRGLRGDARPTFDAAD